MVIVGDTLYYIDIYGYTGLVTDVVSSTLLLSSIALLVRR